MIYSPGNNSVQQPDAKHQLLRNLYLAVVILGLATYGFSFGPETDGGGAIGWHVRFAALAALSAAFGLMTKRPPHALVTAVPATMGLLDALSRIVTAEAGWVLTMIVVLNGAQTAVAVAAMVLTPKVEAGEAAVGYEAAYADYYNQAVQHYYRQQLAAPESAPRGGYGQAQQTAQAPATTEYNAQRPAQYADYTDLISPQRDYGPPSSGIPVEPGQSIPVPGRPGAGTAQPPNAQKRLDGTTRPTSPPYPQE